MKLNTPQVQLFYELVLDDNGGEYYEYYLHAVTFCGRTDLKAAGHALNQEKSAGGDVLKVSLFLQEAPELPKLNSLTPIVHTISLGKLPFDGQGTIETEIKLLPTDGAREITEKIKKGGANTSSTTSADEVDRPLLDF